MLSKNVRSYLLDLLSVATLLILMLLLISGKILLIGIDFFFLKKKR